MFSLALHYYHSLNWLILGTFWVLISCSYFISMSHCLPNFYNLNKCEELNPTLTTIYFYWLDLTLLPSLFTVLIFLILLFNFKQLALRLKHLFIPLFLSMTTTISDIWNMCSAVNNYTLYYHNVNAFLLNSLNKYHPLIFYLSALTVLMLVLIHYTKKSSNDFFTITRLLHLELYLRLPTLSLNALSLFLGSWWALQEWTWGGWWNWDPSETFGLGVSILLLYNAHASLNYWDFLAHRIKTLLLGLLFISSYLLVQLNFEILSHNFGLDSFLFFNKNTHLLYTSVFVILFYNRLKSDYLKPFRTHASPKTFVFYAGSLVTSLIVISPLVLSYWPIVTFILWKFTTFNWATSLVIPLAVFLTLTFLLRESLFKDNEESCPDFALIHLLTTAPLNAWYLKLLRQGKITMYTATHTWFLFLLLLNVNSADQDFFSWTQLPSYQRTVEQAYYLYAPGTIFTYNTYSNQTYIFWRDALQNSFFQQLSATLHKLTIADFYPLITQDSTFYNFHVQPQARYSPVLTTYVHNLTNLTLSSVVIAVVFLYTLKKPSQRLTNINF